MAGQKSSIAGRAHGAKPAPRTTMHTTQYRPQLTGLAGVHPEVARGIQTAFDDLYALRSRVDAMEKTSKAAGAGDASAGKAGQGYDAKSITTPANNKSTGLLGINIKAGTDPTSLKNGDSLRYNSATGEFEFGP
jgi:hypothetical protein